MDLLFDGNTAFVRFAPCLSINLLGRRRATTLRVDPALSHVQLTVGFPHQSITTSLPFVITSKEIVFDVILGSSWKTWCDESDGMMFGTFAWIVSH